MWACPPTTRPANHVIRMPTGLRPLPLPPGITHTSPLVLARPCCFFFFPAPACLSPCLGVWIASPVCICVHVGACNYVLLVVLVHEKEEQKLAGAALIRVCWAQRPGFSFHLLTPTPPFDPKYWFDRQTRSSFCGAAAGCVSAVSCCAVLYCTVLFCTVHAAGK